MPLIGSLYFVSFVMFGTMIMLNLFIGVILNSMDEARLEREHEAREEMGEEQYESMVEKHVEEIEDQMEKLQQSLHALKFEILSKD